MKHIKLIALIGLVWTLSACDRDQWNSGDLVVEDRANSDFYTGIDVDGSIDVIISTDNDFDIRVEAGSRKLKHIVTEVIEEVLYIYEDKNNVANDKQTKVFINQEFLDLINLEGSGDISAQILETDDMDINLRGSGDIDLNFSELSTVDVSIRGSGDVDLVGIGSSAKFDIDGSGDIDAIQLEIETADILIDGSGDVDVNASQELNIIINGSGDVSYLGNPVLNVEINGSGDVGPF